MWEITVLPQEIIEFLPEDKLDKLKEDGQVKEYMIYISATTTENEYKCRKLDYYTVCINFECVYTTDPNQSMETINCSENIIDYVLSNLNVSCPDGKYPSVNISGELNYLSEDYDTDKNRGSVNYRASLWVYQAK